MVLQDKYREIGGDLAEVIELLALDDAAEPRGSRVFFSQ